MRRQFLTDALLSRQLGFQLRNSLCSGGRACYCIPQLCHQLLLLCQLGPHLCRLCMRLHPRVSFELTRCRRVYHLYCVVQAHVAMVDILCCLSLYKRCMSLSVALCYGLGALGIPCTAHPAGC